jgi:hypothetical protein
VKHLFLILVASSLGLINFTKLPESDLLTYYNYFSDFNNIPIYRFTEIVMLDPAFYLPTAILSHITNGYGPAFSLFWTIIIYYVLFLAIIEISEEFNLGYRWVIGIIFFAIFIGYGFSLTAHLVRQYVSTSFLLYAFVKALRGKKHVYLIFIISFLMHHASIIFFPVIYMSYKKKMTTFRLSLFALCFFVFAVLVGNSNLLTYFALITNTSFESINYIISKGMSYVEKNDGDVSLRYFIEFCLLLGGVFTTAILNARYREIGLKISFFFIFLTGLLILFRNTDLLLLRYYFYAFGLTVIALPYISKNIYRFTFIVLLLLIFSSPLRFFRMLENADYQYIENSYGIIFYSFFEFINGALK